MPVAIEYSIEGAGTSVPEVAPMWLVEATGSAEVDSRTSKKKLRGRFFGVEPGTEGGRWFENLSATSVGDSASAFAIAARVVGLTCEEQNNKKARIFVKCLERREMKIRSFDLNSHVAYLENSVAVGDSVGIFRCNGREGGWRHLSVNMLIVIIAIIVVNIIAATNSNAILIDTRTAIIVGGVGWSSVDRCRLLVQARGARL